ncbi:hypothetical protein [Streptomyces sp. NBC_00268]|uniref:hypothetical protein n=1 Tax=Streptomyces sp. NBC_00268 TaxID=2975695 RepID=UPI002256F279|nr:hypothetical protein [Streptomyces sp. NBC_00268]MCX5182597.1 hypothetical protein [Streptomyces sp. NBC_00268]
MTEHRPTAETEEPDLFRFGRPSRPDLRFLGLGTLVAADLGGAVPHGPATGWTVAAAVVAGLLRQYFRWGR